MFDLVKIDPFKMGMREVLEDRSVIKVFHDFHEDTSALINHFDVHCDGVFDTQIAHRILKSDSTDPKDQSISLNSLLYEYLGVENNCKDLIVT